MFGFSASLISALICAAAFAQQARIESVTPPQGPIAGDTVVTIRGADFTDARVMIDHDLITPLSRSDTEVRLLMPRHDNGFVVVHVGNSAAEYLYVPPKLEDLPPGFITTVAGVGQYTRDFGPATQAPLTHPEGLEFDRSGNLYIADTNIYVIYRVRPDGTIERFAGGGFGPDIHDGGPAIDGYFVFPRDIAIDANDNVYIPDVFKCRIRKVDAKSGIIKTVAGNGVCAASGENVLATQSSIHQPTFLTADADDLFFIEWNTTRVRRLHFANGTLSTFIDGGFNLPFDDNGAIAIGPGGDVYLSDYGNNRILRADRHTAAVSTFCATLPGTQGLAFDRDGNLYLGSFGKIQKVDPNGQVIASWGNGQRALPVDGVSAASAPLNNIGGLAIDTAGNIVFSDDQVFRVRRINIATGLLDTVAGIAPGIIGENGPAVATVAVTSPEATDLALTPSNELVIGDAGTFRLRKLDRNGNLITIGGTGAAIGSSPNNIPATEASLYPVGINAEADGSIEITQRGVFTRIGSNGRISVLGAGKGTCGYSGDSGSFQQALLCQPWDFARDRDGNIFIADTNNNRIRRVDAKTNVITTFAGNGGRVSGFERYGQGETCGDGGRAFDACINTPYGIAFDDAGNLYVSEQTGIRRIDTSGAITTFVKKQAPVVTGGITKLLFFHGCFYFVGGGVWRVDPRGVLTQIVPSVSASALIGDGGPARNARTNTGGQAAGIAIDNDGTLFFADTALHRVRAVRNGAYLAPLDATVGASASGSIIRSRVVDGHQQPAPNVRVDFAAPTSGAACSLSAPFAITDVNGTAAVSCTSNCVAGTYEVSAQPLAAGPIATVTITNVAAPCRRRSVRH
ncbi:MAG: IPT/TIG domain-containing protein [Acidobacteriota bacterium]